MPTKKATKGPRDSRWNELAWKQKYGDASRWSGTFASVEENRLALPQDVIDNLTREGIALQWHVESVLGQPQDQALAVAQKNGWQYVEEGELPGVNVVSQGGLRLMARPLAIHKKAEAREKAAAEAAPMRLKQKAGAGDLPMTGADHPSARRSNKHVRTIERLDIPVRDD